MKCKSMQFYIIKQVSASETVEARLKNQDDIRLPASYNREQSQDVAFSGNIKALKNGMRERSGYIDIIYAGNKINGSVKRFGNLGTDTKENRRIYDIEDVMKVFKIFLLNLRSSLI